MTGKVEEYAALITSSWKAHDAALSLRDTMTEVERDEAHSAVRKRWQEMNPSGEHVANDGR